MRSGIRFIVLFIVILGITGSCNDPVIDESPQWESYFPLVIGAVNIFDVDETIIDGTGQFQSIYELRTTMSDSFVNPDGSTSYVIYREKRSTADDPWIPEDTWSARLNDKELVVNEGNIPYVKLAFPVVNGKAWDGNAYNAEGGEDQCGVADNTCDLYLIEEMDKPFETGNGLIFDKTVTVNQNNNTDIIVFQDVRREVYAPGVGLVYKESKVVEYCTSPGCLGQQQIQTGYILRQTLKSYEGY